MSLKNKLNLNEINIFWLPLIIFILILAIFSITSLKVFLNFVTYTPIYDQFIAFLVLLSTVTIGLITIYSYKAGNSLLLFLILLGTAAISLPLGLLKTIWLGVFLASLISILITLYGAKKEKYRLKPSFKSKKSKYLLLILILSIGIHPITSILLSQKTITRKPQDGEIIPRFYHFTDKPLSENTLKNLEKYDAELFLATHRKDLEENSKASKTAQKLNKKGIKIHAWLLEKQENGYWANDFNYSSFENLFYEFKEWEKQENIKFDIVQLDSETLIEGQNPEEFFNENEETGPLEYLSSIWSFYNQGPRREASREYKELINEINENHKSSVACYPIVIEDLFDDDTDLQDAFAVSTYPPKNWNEIVPMVYRIGFYRIIKKDLGSYLVYSYAHSWREKFPQKASVALARPDKIDYEKNINELEKDPLILESLGYDKVTVFNIDLFIETHGENKLNQFLKTLRNTDKNGKIEFSYEPLVSYSRVSVALIDRLL